MRRVSLGVLALGVLLGACARSEARSAGPHPPPWRKPGDAVDSIFPMEEYLRRFREGLPEPAGLRGGEPSQEALARRFLLALATRDTVALGALLVSRAEFGWLVFPGHPYARPPYELDPAIFWLQLRVESAKGLAKTLERFGGTRAELRSVECQRDTLQLHGGGARLWSACRVGLGSDPPVRLFGTVVELEGRYKLLSFASGL